MGRRYPRDDVIVLSCPSFVIITWHFDTLLRRFWPDELRFGNQIQSIFGEETMKVPHSPYIPSTLPVSASSSTSSARIQAQSSDLSSESLNFPPLNPQADRWSSQVRRCSRPSAPGYPHLQQTWSSHRHGFGRNPCLDTVESFRDCKDSMPRIAQFGGGALT